MKEMEQQAEMKILRKTSKGDREEGKRKRERIKIEIGSNSPGGKKIERGPEERERAKKKTWPRLKLKLSKREREREKERVK